MEINITLVFQACNFLIAYILLRKLLLRPTVDVIEHEQTMLNRILSKIESQKIKNIEKEEEKQNRWAAHQKQFALNAPVLKEPRPFVFEPLITIPEPSSVSPDIVQKLTQEAKQELIKKVEHVH